jgi:hypothetical protein
LAKVLGEDRDAQIEPNALSQQPTQLPPEASKMSGKIVFRGSASHPDQKFSEGFYPRHARQGGVQIQSGGQMIGGVSTAKELEPAVRYAASYEGWVYVAYVTDGVDVLEYMLKRSNDWFGGNKWAAGIPNARTQAEIAAPEIPPRQIIAARQAHTVGEMAELFGTSSQLDQCNTGNDRPRRSSPGCNSHAQRRSFGFEKL